MLSCFRYRKNRLWTKHSKEWYNQRNKHKSLATDCKGWFNIQVNWHSCSELVFSWNFTPPPSKVVKWNSSSYQNYVIKATILTGSVKKAEWVHSQDSHNSKIFAFCFQVTSFHSFQFCHIEMISQNCWPEPDIHTYSFTSWLYLACAPPNNLFNTGPQWDKVEMLCT